MLREVLALENRILQDKKELEALMTLHAQQQADEDIKMRIQKLRVDVEGMERQVAELKLQLMQRQVQMQQACMAPNQVQMQQACMASNQVQMQQRYVVPDQPQMQQNYVAPQWNGQMYTPPKRNVEQAIGKTIMAVCASALIFISLIFFAAIVLPHLGTVAKVIMMYGLSASITICGIVMSFMNRENKWYLSLAGCGMGTIYISLLLSVFYFQIINELVLYIGILLWAIAICVLSRMRSEIFAMIGQVGINIAALFGTCLSIWAEADGKLAAVVCYIIFAEIIFFVAHFDRNYNKNSINHIGWMIASFVLTLGVNSGVMQNSVAIDVVSILLIGVFALVNALSVTVWKVDKENSVLFGIANAMQVMMTYAVLSKHWAIGVGIAFVLLLGLLALLEVRIKEWKHAGKIICQCCLFLFLFATVMEIDLLREYLSVGLFAVVFLVYGFWRRNPIFKISGCVYAGLFLLISMNCYLKLALGILGVLCVVAVILRNKEQYQSWMKVLLYLWIFFFILEVSNRMFAEWGITRDEACSTCVFILLTIFQVVVSKAKIWRRNLFTGQVEEEIRFVSAIIANIMMIDCLEKIATAEDGVTVVLRLFSGVVLMVMHDKVIFGKDKKGAISVYYAIVMLLLAGAVCYALDVPGFVISMVCIVVALCCVVFGFLQETKNGVERKMCRVFGLVLVLVSIIKLILIDVHYESMILRAFSFFVSGVLCFGISFVYNLVDKQVKRK